MTPKIITIDLSGPMCDITTEGDDAGQLKPISEQVDSKGRYRDSLAKQFAIAMRTATEGDAIKWLDDSIDLVRTGKLKLTEADYQTYLGFAKTMRGAWALFRAQIIQAFEKGKAEADQLGKQSGQG